MSRKKQTSQPPPPPGPAPLDPLSLLLQSAPQASSEEQQQFQDYLRTLAEQRGATDFLSYMAGAMGSAGPMNERYKQLLEQLKSGNEVMIMQAVIDFSSELTMAQDTAIPQHTLEQFIQPLVDCLKMRAFPDIVLYSTLCITHIIDIHPTLCNKLASSNGVGLLCQKLANVESFELVENVIRALEKIALENPYAIMAGSGLLYMSQLIDFFDYPKQKTILSLLQIVAKSMNAPQDVENYVAPAVDSFKNILKYRDSDDKSKEIMELGSAFYVGLCDAISRFYEFVPANISKFRHDFELVAPEDLLNNIFEMILIGSSSAGYSALSIKTWQNLMATLRYFCKFSPKLCKCTVSNGMLNILQGMLSTNGEAEAAHEDTSQSTKEASEAAILLLDAILPQKHLINIAGKEGENEMERYILETEKEKILVNQGDTIEVLGSAVLPRVIRIYEESPAVSTRFFCLQILDKLFYLCDATAIGKALDHQAAALFMCDNLGSTESLFVCFGLRLTEVVMQKLAKVQRQYIVSLKREGVFERVRQLHDFVYLDKRYGQQADRAWFSVENPYVKHFISYSAKTSPEKRQGASVVAGAVMRGSSSSGSGVPGERQIFRDTSIPAEQRRKFGLHALSSLLPPSYSQAATLQYSMSSQLNYYMFHKSEQLLKEYFENPGILKEIGELAMAHTILAECQKLAAQLDEMLQLGIASTAEQWRGVYQSFADALVRDSTISNHELRSTGIITKLFYSLCMMPTEYVRNMLAPTQEETKADSEEVKANAYKGSQRAELAQMLGRHQVFIHAMARTTNGKKHALSELIHRLNDLLLRIEQYVEDERESMDQLSALQSYSQKVAVTLVYSPRGCKIPTGYVKLRRPGTESSKEPVPEDVKKSPELLRMHEIYSKVSTFPIMAYPWTTIKSLERFVKHRAPHMSELLGLRPPQLRASHSTQKDPSTGPSLRDAEGEPELDANGDEVDDPLFSLGPDYSEGLPGSVLAMAGSPTGRPKLSEAEGLMSLPSLGRAASQTSSEGKGRFACRFFYNGHELLDKTETIVGIMKKYATKTAECPRDAQGVMLFQLCEKKSHTPSRLQTLSEDYASKIERVAREKGSFICGLSAEEQKLLTLCLVETCFSIPEIKESDALSAIKLMKLVHALFHSTWTADKSLAPELALVRDADFLNPKLERLVKKQIQDPLQLITLSASAWLKTVAAQCPFFLTQKTRMLLFRTCYLDKQRGVQYLTQHLKGATPGLGLPLLNVGKPQRMKLKVSRKAILECGVKVMNLHGSSKALLEFDFFDENGSGLGPTLEFYSHSAACLRELEFLWRPMEKGTLFPAPLNPDNWEAGIKGTNTSKICQLFKFMGWLCARAIVDDRLVDLPFAEVFWELVLGKTPTLVDLRKVDSRNGAFFLGLDQLKERKLVILRNRDLNKEQKTRQIESLVIGDGYKVSDMGLTFVLPGYDEIELRRGGKDTLLTIDNLEEYLDLVTLYTLYKTIQPQVAAFREGFNLVVSVEALNCYKTEELEDLVCGGKEEKWDPAILSEQIVPTHGFDKMSPQYVYLIEYLSKLNTNMQRLFLQYATGSPRLPYGGFAKLTPKLSMAKRVTPEGKKPDDFLPSVMTCQNYIKVPEYSSYAVFQTKFDYALKEGQSSFTLS